MFMLSLLVVLVVAISVDSFVYKRIPSYSSFRRSVVEDTDFDAPLEKRVAVGDIVKSGEGKPLDHQPVVSDSEEPDMDPFHSPNPDLVDFDAPLERRMAVGDIVKSGEGKPLDHQPVVSDSEGPDMDPLHAPKS